MASFCGVPFFADASILMDWLKTSVFPASTSSWLASFVLDIELQSGRSPAFPSVVFGLVDSLPALSSDSRLSAFVRKFLEMPLDVDFPICVCFKLDVSLTLPGDFDGPISHLDSCVGDALL